MYQNIGNALFWIWDSLRNRQLWTRMQLAVSPVSQQMLEHFPGLSLPFDSCWWLESGSVVITLSWQCLPAPGGPSMAVLPLWNTGMVSEVWDSQSFLRGAVPGAARPCAEPGCWFATLAAVLQSKLNCIDDSAFPHSCVIFWSLGRSMWLSLHCHSLPWLSWSDQF